MSLLRVRGIEGGSLLPVDGRNKATETGRQFVRYPFHTIQNVGEAVVGVARVKKIANEHGLN